jgi:hypothetical protein
MPWRREPSVCDVDPSPGAWVLRPAFDDRSGQPYAHRHVRKTSSLTGTRCRARAGLRLQRRDPLPQQTADACQMPTRIVLSYLTDLAPGS